MKQSNLGSNQTQFVVLNVGNQNGTDHTLNTAGSDCN